MIEKPSKYKNGKNIKNNNYMELNKKEYAEFSTVNPTTINEEIRAVRGRLMILHNPLHKFDVISELNEENGRILRSKKEKNFEIPIEKARNSIIDGNTEDENETENDEHHELERIKKSYNNNNDYYANGLTLNESNEDFDEIMAMEKEKMINSDMKAITTSSTSNNCEVVASCSPYDAKSLRYFGNIISKGKVLQYSDVRNVHFGVRKNSFFTGYVGNSSDIDKLGELASIVFQQMFICVGGRV